MYNKVKKCLTSMCYNFTECESVEIPDYVKLQNGFQFSNGIYIEVTNNGNIEIWNVTKRKHKFTINKSETYIMMFQLGWCLENI